MIGAFRCDPALKEQALADLKAQIHPGWSITATPQEREALAEAYGMTPGFLSLVMSPRSMTPREVFMHEALVAMAPGADLDALVRDWMLSVWSHPEDGPAVKLRSSPAYEAAAAITDLVESNAIAPVSRQAWREARNALIAVPGLSPAQAGYASVVTSMAWDPTKTPTLAGDVILAWERAAVGEQGLAHDWSKEREDELMEMARACHRRAWERLGERPQDEGAATEYDARFDVERAACMTEIGAAQEWAAFLVFADQVMGPFVTKWYPRAQQTVLDACRRAAQAQPMTEAVLADATGGRGQP